MINFKGKGEHSINELEKIILEKEDIIHELQLKYQDIKSCSCKFYPCSIGDWHAGFDKSDCIDCIKYKLKILKQ